MPKKQKQSKYYEQYFQIFTYFNNLWNKVVRKHVFKVKVENQPKVQDVKVTNPQAPQTSLEISNLEKLEKAFDKNSLDIIKVLEKQIVELKTEQDNSDIVKKLGELKKELKVKDLTPDVIKRLENIGKAITSLDTKTDLSSLEEHLEASYALIDSLKHYTEYDEWKVKINGKQMEELIKAMGKQWISASGTGIIKDGSGNPYSSTNKLPVEATLEVGDIEIGAVELKDGDSDTRADIESDGTKNALFVQANDDSMGTQKIKNAKESSASSNTKVTVGNTPTTVIASNSDRRFVVIVNDSDEDVYLNLSATAVINEGIRINANGGSYIEDIYTGAISGICASGGKNVTVAEV